MDKLTPTIQQEVRDDLYSLGFASDTAPEWFTEDMVDDKNASSLMFNTSSGYATPALTGATATRNKDQLWQDFSRTLLNGADATDEEMDAVDSLISTDTAVKER